MSEHRTREREVAAAAAACQRMSRQQQGLMLGASEHRAQARQREGRQRSGGTCQSVTKIKRGKG